MSQSPSHRELLLLLPLLIVIASLVPTSAAADDAVALETVPVAEESVDLDKRGGGRAFMGGRLFPSAKRVSAADPYYFYEKRGGGRFFLPMAKRGGGRAFVGGWRDLGGVYPRLERRGGGRSFVGPWDGDLISGRYFVPYYNKRATERFPAEQTRLSDFFGGSTFF